MKYQYGPGLPGYGTQGADGSNGLVGISFYFSEYSGDTEITLINGRIVGNKTLDTANVDLPDGRNYQFGDMFVDINGKAWLIDPAVSVGPNRYYYVNRLNASTIFAAGSATTEVPVYERYSNSYVAEKFLVDTVYAKSPIPANYAVSPGSVDPIYGIPAINFAKINYANIDIGDYIPFEIFTNTTDTGAPEKSIALVKHATDDTWRLGNFDATLGVARDVDLVLDFKKVGINTPNPVANLEVSDTYGVAIRIASTKSGTWVAGDILGGYEVYGNDISSVGPGVKTYIRTIANDTFGAAFNMEFGLSSGASAARTRMTIDAQSGNVGIGDPPVTTTYKLDVDGTFRVTGNITADSHIYQGINDRHYFGGSNYGQIYHNGTDFIMASTLDGGRIVLQGEDLSAANKNMIIGDPDGGVTMYWAGDSRISTASWGVNVVGDLTMPTTTTNQLRVPYGTSTAPAIYFGNDTNTGFYWPSADKIGISLGDKKIQLSEDGGDGAYFIPQDCSLVIQPQANSSSASGYGIQLVGSYGNSGSGGHIDIKGGTGPAAGSAGNVSITGGKRSTGTGLHKGGAVNITGGEDTTSSGTVYDGGGNVNITGGDSTAGIGGRVLISGGSGPAGGDGYVQIDASYGQVGILGTKGSGLQIVNPPVGIITHDLGYITPALLGDYFGVYVSTYPSDIRLKDINFSIDGNIFLDKLDDISLYDFNWNEKSKDYFEAGESKIQIGLIAQELEKIHPSLVRTNTGNNNEEFLEIDHKILGQFVVAGMKEQQNQIKDLKQIVEDQQKQINKLLELNNIK